MRLWVARMIQIWNSVRSILCAAGMARAYGVADGYDTMAKVEVPDYLRQAFPKAELTIEGINYLRVTYYDPEAKTMALISLSKYKLDEATTNSHTRARIVQGILDTVQGTTPKRQAESDEAERDASPEPSPAQSL